MNVYYLVSQIPTLKKKKKYMYLIIAFYTPNTIYIYIHRLFQNNSLDVYACQMQIRAALEHKKPKNNTEHNFEKVLFLYENL